MIAGSPNNLFYTLGFESQCYEEIPYFEQPLKSKLLLQQLTFQGHAEIQKYKLLSTDL